MAEPVTIVGQGLAGSMLAWACERAGLAFTVVDRGHATAASRVGGGLVSPLTGRRLVPTWRFGAWRAEAVRAYRELETLLGRPLLRELRVRRVYRDAAERRRFAARCAVPEVAAWVESADDAGLWLRGAIQVDTAGLIAALRERWRAAGRLREAVLERPAAEAGARTIWCVGAAVVGLAARSVPWEPSRGEVLDGRLPGLEPDAVLNDGHWIMPLGPGGAVRVGAIFDRLHLAPEVTTRGQEQLRAAARRLTGREVADGRGQAGLRVTVPDRRPVAGWLDAARTRGVLGGLAAKGALWAPVLAAQWVADDLRGERIEPEARVGRFGLTSD